MKKVVPTRQFGNKLLAGPKVETRTDSGAEAAKAKVIIRRNVLQAVKTPAVFDAFAGSGEMYRNVWHEVPTYMGCDMQFHRGDNRPAFVANASRVMRCIDLKAYNVFDFDSWGSPWEQVVILIARRPVAPNETIGLVITEGQGFRMKFNATSKAFAQIAGISWIMPGMVQERHDLVNRAVTRTARMMKCSIERRWEAHGRKGSLMRHIGLVLKGWSADTALARDVVSEDAIAK